MAMQNIRALVALLVVFSIAGCTSGTTMKEKIRSVHAPTTKQSVAPKQIVTSQGTGSHSAIPAPVVVTQRVLGDFPSSSAKPTGKPWTVMHQDGFTGSIDDACKLHGLSTAQCAVYKAKRSAGECVAMQLPNGVVLDSLTFTRGGKHQVQRNVKVDLKNPLSREAMVCDIGNGVSVQQYLGCGNFGVVRGWTQPLKVERRVDPPVVTAQPTMPGQCTDPLYMQLNVWEAKALEVKGVHEMVTSTGTQGGYFSPNRVSRHFGKTFRGLHNKGELKKSAQAHQVTVTLVKGSQESVLFQGVVVGEKKIGVPNFAPGDVVKVLFAEPSRVVSPLAGHLEAMESEFAKGSCGARTNLHAIEARWAHPARPR